uniref:Uncharacterized protein n=1 Tax=Pipistrellus kuhlii TaxID=59472 RepID=A0A7J7TW17_PIPKU|nr:hypothetical protein mPipKuh1_009236 [Pipistrellus kuhlii]
MFLPMRILGKKAALRHRSVPSEWNVTVEGPVQDVLRADGVGRCRVEMGVSWSPGSQPCSGRTPRSCQVLELLLCEESGLPGGAVRAACQEGRCWRFLCVCILASCVLSTLLVRIPKQRVSLVTSALSVLVKCSGRRVWSVSPLCQAHSEFLASKAELVSNGNSVFLFFTRDRNCFCKKPDTGKTTTEHSAPAPSPEGRDRFKMREKMTLRFVLLPSSPY